MPPPPTPRASSVVEWLLAAASTLGVLWAGATWVRPYIAPEREARAEIVSSEDAPVGVPSGSVSTPLLVLDDGMEARVGMSAGELAELVKHCEPASAPQVSTGAFGPRTLRGYTHRQTRFYVVSESTEPGGPVRVTGIYVP